MSAVDDVGQICWIGFHGTRMTPELARRVGAGECGAVVLFKRNLEIATGPDGDVIDLDALAALVAGQRVAGARTRCTTPPS